MSESGYSEEFQDHDEDGAGAVDEIPSKQSSKAKPIIKNTNTINYPLDEKKKPSTSQSKSVRFTTPGEAAKKQPTGLSKTTTPAEKEVKVEPTKLEKLKQQQAFEQKRKYLTFEDIVSDSKSNKHIIYKFMKKGFTALSAEELACTMVNPTFSIDFKANVGEDWNIHYQAKVVEKLQKCKFHMHWFIKQASASPGYADKHEAFMKIVASGNMDQIFMYLRSHDCQEVLNSVDQKTKKSPLHIAAKYGYQLIVKFFLDRNANIEARDKLLKTSLHYACEGGHALVVKELMERGADVFDRDNCGRTAMHYAVYSGQTDIITRLTKQSTDIIHLKDHAGRTPLHHAVFMEANQVRLISQLLDYGADVNALDSDKRSALHHAAESNKPRVIPVLVQNGAHTSLKDSLTKKTPLELAANDHIQELIIAYCSPDYMPDEHQINKRSRKKYLETLNNQKSTTRSSVENPFKTLKGGKESLAKQKSANKKPSQKVVEQIIVQQVQPTEGTQVCSQCQQMKGLGPVNDWEQQQQKFIPFNMRNYQQRLMQLLKRIQVFGVESFVFQKKPYLYTGSWMEYVRNLDDLMLQINGVNPNEACMKIFNVLFPYPDALPSGHGDETALSGFFDGVTNVDKQKSTKDCLPEQLLDNLSKKQEMPDLATNHLENVQDLLNIKNEVMSLRSTQNIMELSAQAKDEEISRLKQSEKALKEKIQELQLGGDERSLILQAKVNQYQEQMEKLNEANDRLQNQIKVLQDHLGQAKLELIDAPKPGDANVLQSLEKLVLEHEKLKQKHELLNQKDKALRHKAGQVFLQSLKDGASSSNTSVKNQNGQSVIYLEDEEAVHRMLKEIDLQEKGDLTRRIREVGHPNSSIISQKQFTSFVKDELHMDDADLLRLLRVSKFAELKKDKTMKQELVVKNIEDRIANSAQAKEDIVKKVADQMVKQGISMESAFAYLDADESGTIGRDELNKGFQLMKISVGPALLKSLFVLLDKDGDNEISMLEFEAVFAPYLNTKGGPVKEVTAEELENEITGIDKETAKDLAKQMKTEIKTKQEYVDQKLEAATDEDLQQREEQRIQQIKAGTLPEKEIGGELEVRLVKGVNFVDVPGKEQFGFKYDLPRYDKEGKIIDDGGGGVQLKMADPETGEFKTKVKLLVQKHNMYMYQDAIKISCCKLDSEATKATFQRAEKEELGCILVMWKECVEKAQGGVSQMLQFNEELRDPDGLSNQGVSGMIAGSITWIEFGHDRSSYNADGTRKAPKQVQKQAADYKGPHKGAGGSLSVLTRSYTHPTELSLETQYCVHYQLLKADKTPIAGGETLSAATNGAERLQTPASCRWVDTKDIAIEDQAEAAFLEMTFMTQAHGLEVGTPIASMVLDLAAKEIFTKKNAGGQFKQDLKGLKLQFKDDASKFGEFRVALVYKPLAPEKLPAASAALPVAKAEEAYQPTAALAGKQQPPQADEERPHPPAPEEAKFQMPEDDENDGEEEEEVDADGEYEEPELPDEIM